MIRAKHAWRLATCLLAAAIAGCGGGGSGSGSGDAPPERRQPMTGPSAPTFPSSLDGLQRSPAPFGRQAQAADSGYTVDTSNREAVRLFYKAVYGSSSGVASGWSGDLATCNAGDTSADYKAAVLRRINWYRAMAGVPAGVQLDATFNQKAQQAAMLMAANQTLSHAPPVSWSCYNATAAEAAGKSNLTLGHTGPDSVGDAYVRDSGANNSVVGHRRWVLYPQTQFMGTGDVDAQANGGMATNALWVQDANIFGARPAVRDDFVAWPAKGYTPYTTVYPRWSFSYPHADFSSATVAMTENGVPIATRLETPVSGFGENTLVWFPGAYVDGMDWAKPVADTVYQVTVSNVLVAGVARSFTYNATIFDPDSTSNPALSISGSDALAANQAGTFSIGAVSGATSYQWRTLAVTPFSFDGAETGAGNFTVTTSGEYSVVANDVAATGGQSFHLAHATPTDQVLQLTKPLVVGAGASLSFASRLGLSSPAQHALVEASMDDGATWIGLFAQAGQQTGSTSDFGETSFSTKSISLAAFANRSLLLRWRYVLDSNSSYYPQTSTGIGWYIDGIQLTGVSAVSSSGTPTEITAASFQASAASGPLVLQARAGMYGYFGEWGSIKTVTVSTATGADCLFNWAEANYPGLFSPAASSLSITPYYFRHYTATNAYLGVSSADGHVYYLGAQGLQDVGPQAGWLLTAGCSP
jgi:hypothetical protein